VYACQVDGSTIVLVQFKHSLPSLVLWCTGDSGHNSLKWPTILDIN
jgi:hypothetical protein